MRNRKASSVRKSDIMSYFSYDCLRLAPKSIAFGLKALQYLRVSCCVIARQGSPLDMGNCARSRGVLCNEG